MKRATQSVASIALFTGLLMWCPAHAAITAAEVPKLVKSAHILAKGYDGCTSVVKGDQVHITLLRNPKEDESDLKINSILIGKTIMDKDPAINIVRVNFLEQARNQAGTLDQKYTFVDASKAIVRSYASGQVDKDALLASMSLHVYTNAATMRSVVEKSVGMGPLYGWRQTLQSQLFVASGGDETEQNQILPSVDQFASRMKYVNEMAHTNKPEADIRAQLTLLEKDLKTAIASWHAFEKGNPSKAMALQVKYLQDHRIAVPANMRPTVAASTPQIHGVPHVTASTAQFSQWSLKYPQFTPDASIKTDLARRQKVGLQLMRLAEEGRQSSQSAREFLDVESAARVSDKVALNVRLRALERSLGLIPF